MLKTTIISIVCMAVLAVAIVWAATSRSVRPKHFAAVDRRSQMELGIMAAKRDCKRLGGDETKLIVGHSLMFPLHSPEPFVMKCVKHTINDAKSIAVYRIKATPTDVSIDKR